MPNANGWMDVSISQKRESNTPRHDRRQTDPQRGAASVWRLFEFATLALRCESGRTGFGYIKPRFKEHHRVLNLKLTPKLNMNGL